MSANNHKGGGGAVVLLLAIAGAFLWSPGKLKVKAPKAAKMPTANVAMIESTKFHVVRFYGGKPNAPRAILEHEAEKAAAKHGIDHRIFKALVKVESAWNPKAKSPVGARGLTQVMIQNSKRCGLKNPSELWDPVKNLHCGAQILSEDLRTYGGNMRNALKSYNCGRINCPPAEQYASKILSLSEKMKG